MGRKPDLNTPAQYQIFYTHIGYKNGCAKCRHCAKVGINNTNRMKLYLTECRPYQQFLATQIAERAAKKRRIDINEKDFIQVIIGNYLTPARYARADELAALIIY